MPERNYLMMKAATTAVQDEGSDEGSDGVQDESSGREFRTRVQDKGSQRRQVNQSVVNLRREPPS